MNVMMVIFPYKVEGIWMFDDAATGLVREPFVEFVNVFLDELTEGIPDAERGFRMLFSAQPFPGYAMQLSRRYEEYGGYWYACQQLGGQEGWLCPALFKYFAAAPADIYVKAEAITQA